MGSCIDPKLNHPQAKPASPPPKAPKSPYRWLLMIPIQLIIYGVSFPAGIAVDILYWQYVYMTKPPDAELGHGLPVFSILIPLLGTVLTVLIIILSVIITIVAVYLRRKRDGDSAR